MKAPPLTAAEIEYLREHYPVLTLRAMARHLGRRWQTVQYYADRLIRQGVLTRRQRAWNPPWTAEEDEYLADHWGLLPDATVARKLGRTVAACKIRATRRHSLARSQQFYTARTVARLFGVDDHVVKRWIRAGVLKARPSHVRAGGGGVMWRIDDLDLQAFVKRYPYHYDRQRIERGTWWRNLADRVWAQDPYLTLPEAAAQLGIHRHTLTRWCWEGRIAAVKTWSAGKSGGWRLAQSTVSAFVVPQWGTTGKHCPRRPRTGRMVYAELRSGRIIIIGEAA